MKNLLIVAGLVFLAACTKNTDTQFTKQQQGEKQSCDFGIKQFNLTKRANVQDNQELQRNPHTYTGNSGSTSTTSSGGAVILLDFDGQTVTSPYWNNGNTFVCAPANLATSDISLIVQRIANDYSPFNVTVTTDENVFNAANIYKRQRVIVTESWEWYGQAGGVSIVGSFTSGNNTPCFVFSSLLSYGTKYIAEACSHEAGHTLGLRHQSVWDGSCVKTSEYNQGQGSGEIGWAPIMGNSYYENLSLWNKGTNSISCSTIQDDVSTIVNVLGYVNDDYSNSFSGAAPLSSTLNGVINNSNDIDFFSVNLLTTKTISASPFNVGANNSGGNVDLVLNVYNSSGVLIATVNDPSLLNASVTLDPGVYYVSVGTTSNAYASTYGMLGKYSISLN